MKICKIYLQQCENTELRSIHFLVLNRGEDHLTKVDQGEYERSKMVDEIGWHIIKRLN